MPYDAQVAALQPPGDPVQRKEASAGGGGGGGGAARLQQEIAEAARPGGDDDYVRDTIRAAHLKVATAAQKARMIVNLLDGSTGDDDEAMILRILESPNGYQTFLAVARMGHWEWLWDDVNGAENKALHALYAKVKASAAKAELKALKAKQEAKKKKQQAKKNQKPPEGSQDKAAAAGAPGAAPDPDAITQPDDPRLSEDRKKVLYEGERRMGSTPSGIAPHAPGARDRYYTGVKPKNEYGDDAENLFAGSRVQDTGTSCGLLPGVLLRKLDLHLNSRVSPIAQFVTSNGKAAPGMEMHARQYDAWVESDGEARPRPADIYVMHDLAGAFAHVGVVHTVGERYWTTMDSGQGRGLNDMAKSAQKTIFTQAEKDTYNADKGNPIKLGAGLYHAAYGSTPDTEGKHPRRVQGWVDLDRLLAYERGKTPKPKGGG